MIPVVSDRDSYRLLNMRLELASLESAVLNQSHYERLDVITGFVDLSREVLFFIRDGSGAKSMLPAGYNVNISSALEYDVAQTLLFKVRDVLSRTSLPRSEQSFLERELRSLCNRSANLLSRALDAGVSKQLELSHSAFLHELLVGVSSALLLFPSEPGVSLGLSVHPRAFEMQTAVHNANMCYAKSTLGMSASADDNLIGRELFRALKTVVGVFDLYKTVSPFPEFTKVREQLFTHVAQEHTQHEDVFFPLCTLLCEVLEEFVEDFLSASSKPVTVHYNTNLHKEASTVSVNNGVLSSVLENSQLQFRRVYAQQFLSKGALFTSEQVYVSKVPSFVVALLQLGHRASHESSAPYVLSSSEEEKVSEVLNASASKEVMLLLLGRGAPFPTVLKGVSRL